MSLATRAVSTGLMGAYARPHRRLLGIGDLRGVQLDLARRLVEANASTWYGRQHDFDRLRSLEDYRAAVPLVGWDDLAGAVERIAGGEPGVLTAEPVRLLEPSSGSTAASKLIPYTATLLRQFRAGLQPWLHDLYAHHRGLRRGRSYWSATPAATHPRRDTAIPVGFEDDTAYLGPLAGRLMGALFAVDPDVARTTDMEQFRVRTAIGLLAAEDLALASVWNPTFLTVLLDWMAEHPERVLPGLSPARRRVVGPALAARDWATIWPHLQVLSCWADAQARGPADELAARLPQATVQPKGLLATEALVTIPLVAATGTGVASSGAVLAARSHLVEFLAPDGTCLLGDEVEVGHRYEVVVTTGGGLYRYRLGDLVEVIGWHGALPVLRFVGRADRVSDLVGEKLHEAHVVACLAAAGITGHAVLVAHADPHPHYVLEAERADAAAVARLEAGLRESFHYDYARRLGQLGPAVLHRVGPDAARRHLAACVARGMRLGDVKTAALVPVSWSQPSGGRP